MTNEENKIETEKITVNENQNISPVAGPKDRKEKFFDRGGDRPKRSFSSSGKKDGLRTNNYGRDRAVEEFTSETLEVRRVSKTTTGGKKLSFSAMVVIGNGNGTIGIGKGKDKEVSGAINKALNDAHKNTIRIPRYRSTIVHDVKGKFGATSILLKKAKPGTGCISCNAIKTMMRIGGVDNLVAKVHGSSTLRNVVGGVLNGIRKLESPKSIAIRRGKTIEAILGVEHKNKKEDRKPQMKNERVNI